MVFLPEETRRMIAVYDDALGVPQIGVAYLLEDGFPVSPQTLKKVWERARLEVKGLLRVRKERIAKHLKEYGRNPYEIARRLKQDSELLAIQPEVVERHIEKMGYEREIRVGSGNTGNFGSYRQTMVGVKSMPRSYYGEPAETYACSAP